MKQGYIACIFAMALSGVTLSVAYAQGRSADSNGHVGGTSQGGLGSANTGSLSVSDQPASQSATTGTDSIGGYGQLGASHNIDIGDSMFLQLYGGVDLDQQKSADPAGALDGRVGLGWKY